MELGFLIRVGIQIKPLTSYVELNFGSTVRTNERSFALSFRRRKTAIEAIVRLA
jgi:hypothetical protein